MKKIFVLVFFTVTIFSCSKKDEVIAEDSEIYNYNIVEVLPVYPGGEKEMYQFLGSNMNYPVQAKKAGIQGRVTARFIIEKNGSIKDVNIVSGIGYGCDEEVVRIIKLMPQWSPGKNNGKNVRVSIIMPFVFTLPE